MDRDNIVSIKVSLYVTKWERRAVNAGYIGGSMKQKGEGGYQVSRMWVSEHIRIGNYERHRYVLETVIHEIDSITSKHRGES